MVTATPPAEPDSIVYRVEGTRYLPELNFVNKRVAVVFEPGARLIHTPTPDAHKDPERAAVRFLNGASGGIRGGVIDAAGTYAGVFVAQDAGHVTLEGVTVRDAGYKSFHIMSDAIVRDCSASSDIDGTDGTYRPMGLLIDPGSKQAGRVTVENFTLGMFTGTKAGQLVKVACTNDVRLSNIQTPELDKKTRHSLVLAENLKLVVVTDSTLPRMVTHFPDKPGDPTVDVLVFSNVTFGNKTDPPPMIHRDLNARKVIYHNCRFLNLQALVIRDATPADEIDARVFLGCTFETATPGSVLIRHVKGDTALAGKLLHHGCRFETRGQGRYVMPAGWDKGAVNPPEKTDVDTLIRWRPGK